MSAPAELGIPAQLGTPAQLGIIGLGVMGRALARNAADHGFPVCGWDPNAEARARLAADGAAPGVQVADELAGLPPRLARPRRVLLMVPAGDPVDSALDALEPLLDAGDIVVDGGNSHFEDTARREARLAASGLAFVGMGVSGGEEGARRGPSLMPGGAATAYEALRPLLEAIAAKSDAGPCVTHVGPGGAGHFVKTVHNGIEYAEMQLLAEAYDALRRGLGLDADALAARFAEWNTGLLESFLVELTARVLGIRDERTGGPLVELVLDRAGQKGTGRWTAQAALKLGVPVPTLAAAVDARGLSSRKAERVQAATVLAGPDAAPADLARDLTPDGVRDALIAARLCAWAQGVHLIRAASDEHGWGIDVAEVARIWKAGCILRARLLDDVRAAFANVPSPPSLLLADGIRAMLAPRVGALRALVAGTARAGLPAPAHASALAYFDALRTADLPQNLTQAQRDAFGAHGYVRRDDPDGAPVHSSW